MIEAGKASSIGELIGEVWRIARKWQPDITAPQEIWFRGQEKADYSLLPGLYRPSVEQLNYDEVALFTRFKNLATPYVDRLPASEWEWYFLAQHYGLPTRLLDWSESLLAATYFALSARILSSDRLALDKELGRRRRAARFDHDSPAVWLLDAGTINKVAVGEDSSFTPGGSLTAPYLPEGLGRARKDKKNKRPLAILAPRANARITAQQGVFTVHGYDRKPLDRLARNHDEIQLARIVLDGNNLARLWYELEVSGVTKYAMFPAVDTAADHVRWIMQSVRPTTT